MSEFLTELEGFPDLEGSIIRVTKIHKVLKQILKLSSIPLEEQFHFKDRSRDLLAKWNDTLNNDPAGAGEKEEGGAKDADEPKTPGLPAAAPAAATSNGEEPKPTENGSKEPEKAEEAAAPAAAAAAEPEATPAEKPEAKTETPAVEAVKEPEAPKAEEKAEEKVESKAEEPKKDEAPAAVTEVEAPAEVLKPETVAAVEAGGVA